MITRCICAASAVLLGWVGVLATVMWLSDAAPAALVMFPDAAFLSALPEGIAITGRTALSVTLTSEAEGFARLLYQAGAPLVLPAGLSGCSASTT